jgi:hypothetical protein
MPGIEKGIRKGAKKEPSVPNIYNEAENILHIMLRVFETSIWRMNAMCVK